MSSTSKGAVPATTVGIMRQATAPVPTVSKSQQPSRSISLNSLASLQQPNLISGNSLNGSNTDIGPRFSAVGDSLRHNIPSEMQCAMFCGGRRCKYETGDVWQPEQTAIKGLFSHWVTDEVLAMARPNYETMARHDIIGQMIASGIRSVVNLQIPGEHASCGPKLHPSSGFSYDPDELMKSGIAFYNFAWKDYSDAPISVLLDMVKVVSFAATEGKVAVHCHAGLGRTGVLIACYLIFKQRVKADDALRYVRMKRPGSVQTRRQIDCVKEFESFFLPKCHVFGNNDALIDVNTRSNRFTLEQHLKRQRSVVHGYEARALKHIPKIVFVVCERLVGLCCGRESVYRVEEGNFTRSFFSAAMEKGGSVTVGNPSPGSSVVDFNRSSSCASVMSGMNETPSPLLSSLSETTMTSSSVDEVRFTPQEVCDALLDSHGEKEDSEGAGLVLQYRNELNLAQSAWDAISTETDLFALTGLLFEWLEHLRSPVLDRDSITYVVIHCDKSVESALRRLPKHVCYLLEYLVRFVARLQPLSRESSRDLMRRVAAALTHQSIQVGEVLHPTTGGGVGAKRFPKLRGGTAESTIRFMMKMFDQVTSSFSSSDNCSSSSNFDDNLSSFSGSFVLSSSSSETATTGAPSTPNSAPSSPSPPSFQMQLKAHSYDEGEKDDVKIGDDDDDCDVMVVEDELKALNLM